MKTTRETSSSPGFTKNSMYVMPRRGSSTSVAFTAFLGCGVAGGETQSHSPLQRGLRVGGGRSQKCLRLGGGAGALGGTARPGWGRQDQLPVLNGLRCSGRPKFGHEDANDVEEEDEIDLQCEHRVGWCGHARVYKMLWGAWVDRLGTQFLALHPHL